MRAQGRKVRPAQRTSAGEVTMTSLAIAILLLSAPAPVSAPAPAAADPLFDPAVACTIADDALFSAPESTPEPAAPTPALEPEPRSLVRAAESRVSQEDPSQQAISVAVRADRSAL